MTAFSTFLKQHVPHHHANQGITICPVADADAGIKLAEKLLYDYVDRRTSLYLSGGKTPKTLYTNLANEEKLHPGAVGLVDERFGSKFHDNSNEYMIRETGFTRYLEMVDIPFYPIIPSHPELVSGSQEEGMLKQVQHDKQRKYAAQLYDEKVRHLNATFPKSLAILGVGVDGHISSLAPNHKGFNNPMFDSSQQSLFVSEFNDPKSFYGERVGMTFTGLSMMDVLVVLVFGEDKKLALDAILEEGPEEEVPARFLKRPEIAEKTLIITDQAI